MKRQLRKLIAFVLALSMMVSLLCSTAWAQNEVSTEEPTGVESSTAAENFINDRISVEASDKRAETMKTVSKAEGSGLETAASYPLVLISSITASVGENVPLFCDYYPAFTNEELIMHVYDENGREIGSPTSGTFYNSSFMRYWTVWWDTTGERAGTYKIVVEKKFYSLYSWHTAPTDSVGYLTLVNDLRKYRTEIAHIETV